MPTRTLSYDEPNDPKNSSRFSTPEHPSIKLKDSTLHDATLDAHKQPLFTSESIVNPSQPVLYLPPLISSLPPSAAAAAPAHAPVQEPVTQTQDGSLPTVLTTETHLPNIDPVSLSLHRALHYFRPLTSAYAATPYAEAFNWSELSLSEEEERDWYCVAFRSRRKEGSNGDNLYEADRLAHEEAVGNGGLLMYWFGVPDPETGLNLATCIWQSRRHAQAANSQPYHVRAMRLARDAYEVYTLERYVLSKKCGNAHVSVESYEGGDVGW